MRSLPVILLAGGLVCAIGFGPHPEEFGNMWPESHFDVAPPISTYEIRQGARRIYSYGGEISLCDGPTCPAPAQQPAKARHLEADLGPIDYSVPLSAWMPFYQSGEIVAKIPVTFTRDGKKAGTYPNGKDIPLDSLTVSVHVSRIGLIPLGHFDNRVEYVVLEGAKAGIAKRIGEGNREIAASEARVKALR
jgi:hypothetical protein